MEKQERKKGYYKKRIFDVIQIGTRIDWLSTLFDIFTQTKKHICYTSKQ